MNIIQLLLIVFGVIMILAGLLSANKKSATWWIRKSNELRGTKGQITDVSVKTQIRMNIVLAVFGGIIILLSFILPWSN